MDIYMHSVNEAAEGIDIDEAVDSGNEGTDEVLDYVYEHFTAFKLIFCRSAGTSYEHFFDKLIRNLRRSMPHRGFISVISLFM